MSTSGSQTSQTSGLPAELMPYLQQYGNLASGVATLPYQQYNGPRVAPLSGTQQNAISGINGMMGGTPSTNAADQMYQQTLMGQGGNQFTPQVIDAAHRSATQAYGDATAGITGRFNTGSGNFGGVRDQMAQDRANTDLATGLANADGTLYSNAYENERNRQMQAASGAGGLYSTLMSGLGSGLSAGGLEQQYGQNLMNSQYNDFTAARDYPQTQLGILGNALSPLFGGTFRQTTSTGAAPDPLQQGLGLAMLGRYGGLGSGSKSS